MDVWNRKYKICLKCGKKYYKNNSLCVNIDCLDSCNGGPVGYLLLVGVVILISLNLVMIIVVFARLIS